MVYHAYDRNSFFAMLENAAKIFSDLEMQQFPDVTKRKEKNVIYVAGGIAYMFYGMTDRYSMDMDVFCKNVFSIPPIIVGTIMDDQGKAVPVLADGNFRPMNTLIHEDYEENSVLIIETPTLEIRALGIYDLLLSKIARYKPKDRQDIRSLLECTDVDPERLQKMGEDAVNTTWIGQPEEIMRRLHEVCAMARQVLEERNVAHDHSYGLRS